MIKVLRQINKLTKTNFKLQVLGALLTILYAITTVFGPLASGFLIDVIIPSGSMETLKYGMLIFALAFLCQPFIGIIKDNLFLLVIERITKNLRNNLYESTLFANMTFFDKTKKGGIISRILQDSRSVGMFVSDFFIVFLKNIIQLIVVIICMFYISSKITLIVLVSLLIYFLIFLLLTNRLSVLQLEVQENMDDLTTEIEQMTSNIINIKTQQLEDKSIYRFNNKLDKSYKDNLKIGSLEILVSNLSFIVVILALVIIYGVGAIGVMNGQMTLGSIVTLGLFFQELINPVMELFSSGIDFRKMKPILKRIEDFNELDQEDIMPASENNTALTSKNISELMSGDIGLENIKFSYPNRELLFDNLNLVIPGGETTCLIGGSGSGKSTIAKLILGLYEPLEGNIKFSGVDIENIGLANVRSEIGYVSQHIELMNVSIKDNLSANQNISDDYLVELCKDFQLDDKIQGLEDAYDTIVSERINFSGGERQRLAIIRALLRDPEILIFDEPTSALDTNNIEIIKNIINKIKDKYTILVITHDNKLLDVSDNIISLENIKY